MSDFPEGTIEVRLTTDNWGPFNFDMTGMIPSDDSIASFTTSAHVGEVLPTYTLSDYADISASLIEADPAPLTDGTNLSVYMKWPGATYKGNSITLVFQVTYTVKTGVYPFYFYKVNVQ